MNYALLENNIIVNIIYLHPDNANDFPNAVPLNNTSAGIGDEYKDGDFYRNGEKIITEEEKLYKITQEQEALIAELDAALLDMAYSNLV